MYLKRQDKVQSLMELDEDRAVELLVSGVERDENEGLAGGGGNQGVEVGVGDVGAVALVP